MKTDGRSDQVDALFSRWAKSDSPGCAVAVLQEGEIVYKQGYGMANLEYDIPITPLTIFHVASVSKQFVAAAIALLEQDGKLSGSDDVRKYLPELHDFGEMITIDHLINHTSGLRDQWDLLVMAGWRMEDVITTDDILELVFAQRELNFKPGAEYRYSNTGYTLAGLIVGRVSGKSLREFCAERIFEPLGMTHTHFHDDHSELVANRAYSYQPKGEREADGFQHSHLLYANVGATSLFTTVEDLLRWEQNFMTPRVGNQAFVDRMVQQALLNDGDPITYAYGLVAREYRGLRAVEHSGGDAGYRTHLIHFPDQHFAVTVLSNLATMRPGTLALQIADIYLSDHLSDASESVVNLPAAQVEQLAGYYYSSNTHESLQLSYDPERQALHLSTWLTFEALDGNHFRALEAPNYRLEFTDSSPVCCVVTDGMGRPETYERVAPFTLSAEAAGAYSGVYICPELDVKYTFALENDELVLRRRKYGQAALTPIFMDAFIEEKLGFDLFFIRDSENTITGFELTTGRVRRLRFKRIDPDVG